MSSPMLTPPATAGRVLGSQIYVGESVEDVSHDVPFSIRDIFINTINGNIYQFDGAEWVYCYTIGAGTLGSMVRYAFSDSEALDYDVNSVVIVMPSGGVPRVTRVAADTYGAKELVTLGLGDGSLAFITAAVSDLRNYYLKSEVYNKVEIDAFLGAIRTIEFRVVEELPPTGQSNIIYLVPHTHGTLDYYDEYCWVESESKFEKIGNTDALVNYYTKSEVDALLSPKADKSYVDGQLALKANAGDSYTKAEDDALLANKADAGDSYTKAQEDAKLALKADKSDTYTKAEVDSKVSSVYHYRGSVRLYSDLPLSGMAIGDVYNIETADPTHGVKAGDNVAWNGMSWDVLAGTVDLNGYYTKGETDALLAPKANSADVYDKSQTYAKTETYSKGEADALLAGKANVGASYTKSEEDTLLAAKADVGDSYTKAEDDALLAGKVDKIVGKQLSTEDYTSAEKAKLAGVEAGAQVNAVESVAGKTGAVSLVKSDVGLGNVDNTSDVNKPVSTAQQAALDNKVDKVSGKALSSNDYTDTEKNKLAGIESGAQVNAVESVAGKTGAVTLTKSDVGLGNVENTSDANKPVSTAQQAALALKADKSDTYTKSEVGALLAPKANAADLGTAATKNVGTASGNVPIIGADGKLDPTVMPAIAMSDTYVVTSQADMLALNARVGDVAVRTDENKTYILKETGASTLSHWQELLVPTDDILEALIEPFLTTIDYAKGDYVVYNNVLYRFTADKAAGSWDSTKVESATLNDLIDDVNAAVASVNDKVDPDDICPDLRAGYADLANNLDTKVVQNDVEAYNFRTSGGSLEIGDTCKVKAIVGGSLGWNQLMMKERLRATYTADDITVTNNGDGSITFSGTASAQTWVYAFAKGLTSDQYIALTKNHKYLVANSGNTNLTTELWINLDDASASYESITAGGKVISGYSALTQIFKSIPQGTTVDTTFYPQIIDLTACFGATIADYIYSLEQATAGAGVAWFRRYFPKSYYPYKAIGGFTNVQTKGKKVVGFNQWDEQWELGGIDPNTGVNNSTSTIIRSKNYIRVLPNTTYFFKCPASTGGRYFYYDVDKKFISATYIGENSIFAIPSNAHYLRFTMSSTYGTTYNHDICINFHYDGERDGEYEAYETETYDVDPIELIGIPKIDAQGNLYFEGNRYNSDGVVDEVDGDVDLGTLNWEWQNYGVYGHLYAAQLPSAYKFVSNNQKAEMFCTKYEPTSYLDLYNNDVTGISYAFNDGNYVFIKDNSYANDASGATALKTALSGIHLIYKKATATQSSATPYQKTQKVNNWGTEEWLAPDSDTRDVEVPVGHDTDYLLDIKSKVEIAPDLPSSDGTYVCKVESGTAEYTPLDTYLSENGYVKQQDFSNQITDVAGLTYQSKSLIVVGKIATLTLRLKNETGSVIAANTPLFSVPQGAKPPFDLYLNGGMYPSGSIYFTNGTVTISNSISTNANVFISISYVVS